MRLLQAYVCFKNRGAAFCCSCAGCYALESLRTTAGCVHGAFRNRFERRRGGASVLAGGAACGDGSGKVLRGAAVGPV